MTEKVSSIERLEEILGEIEPQLPFGVHYLCRLIGVGFCSTYADGPKEVPPNPIRKLWFGVDGGWPPLITIVELFRPIQGRRGGWLYTLHFVLDDLLSSDEVRNKVLKAAHVLASEPGKTCTWGAYQR